MAFFFFFEVQGNAYCDNLVTLMISQPFISLDNTELYFYFLVKTRSTAVTDFIFPLRTYKKTEVLNDPHLVWQSSNSTSTYTG